MDLINAYPGPYHWYQSKFQFLKYNRQFALARTLVSKESVVLDLGCGDGRMTNIIADKVEFVYGVDNQRRAISFARLMTCKKNTAFLVAQGRLPFHDRFFDAVFCFDVIEHIKPDEVGVFLSEMWRVLKEGGHCIISTPNRKSLHNRIFGHHIDKKHYYEFDVPELKYLLKKNKFVVKKISGIYIPPIFRCEMIGCYKLCLWLLKPFVRVGKYFPEISEKLVFIVSKE